MGGRTRASSAASRVVPARSKSNMIMSHRMSRRVASRRSRRRFFFSAAALILNARVAYFFLGFFAPLKRPSFRSPSYPAPMTPESRTAALRNHSAKDFFSPWWTEGAGAGVEGQRFGLLFVVCCFAPPRKNNTSGAPSGGATRPSGRRCVTGDVDRWLRSSRGEFYPKHPRDARASPRPRLGRNRADPARVDRVRSRSCAFPRREARYGARAAFAVARSARGMGEKNRARPGRAWSGRRRAPSCQRWASRPPSSWCCERCGWRGRWRRRPRGCRRGGHGEHLRACVARVS